MSGIYRLSHEEFSETVEKVNKANARAEEKGLSGRVTVSGQTKTDKDRYGNEYSYVETTISGETPKYEGWEFLAAVDTVDAEAHTFVIRAIEGADTSQIDRNKLRAGQCEHCHIEKSNRIYTYLVRNVDTGELKQIGSTCIRDFLGIRVTPVFHFEDSAKDEFIGGSSSHSHEYTVQTVVSAAVACVDRFGYRSAASHDSTRDTVGSYLYPFTSADKDFAKSLAPAVSESQSKAQAIIDRLCEEYRDSTSGYEANMYAVLTASHVATKHLGLAVSSVVAYQKLVDGDKLRDQWASEKKEREERKAALTHIGTVGEKITITGVVTRNMAIDTMYGTSNFVIVSGDNFEIKMFTTAQWSNSTAADVGQTVTLTGTVKNHEFYNGTPQTVLTRAKLQ